MDYTNFSDADEGIRIVEGKAIGFSAVATAWE